MSKEDYTIIETAIEYGVSVWGKKDIMAIQIAGFWIDGWLEAKAGEISPDVALFIKTSVQTYCFE